LHGLRTGRCYSMLINVRWCTGDITIDILITLWVVVHWNL